MTLWTILTALCFAALAFVVWPLYRQSGRLTLLLAGVIVFSVGLSAALYHRIGSPEVPSGAGTMPDVNEMVTLLAERLEENPDDAYGWTMLGQSYATLQRFAESIAAYEKAIELEEGQDSGSLVGLAIVLTNSQGGAISSRAASLLDDALVLEPDNQNALFYSGYAAASRGDTAGAADHWERLMALNPSPEIQELLEQKISEWRGVSPPPVASSGVIVATRLSLSANALAVLPPEATVFVIARDPAQPSPPIAVARRQLSELPTVVELSDRDSMVPGRSLSAFPQFEIVVRVSLSGGPMAQSGDWFGSMIFNASQDSTVDLVIDQQVP